MSFIPEIPDVSPTDLKLEIQTKNLTFSGHSSSLKRDYHVELEFYDEIDPDKCKRSHTSKNIELVLIKKELKDEYWPRLLKDNKKPHFLRTDFDKWVDEDEQNEAPENDAALSGGMGGIPGMGDMSSMMGGAGGDFGGIDFSKLGGDMSEEDEEVEEEDMPSLEGDDEKTETATEPKDTTEPTSKAKIEEVS